MAAPDLTQKLTVFVQKEGTDDLSANFPGRPYSRLTIDRALLDLADTSRYPAASSTFFHIVAIGPGTFVLDQLPPPWTFFNGSCDGEGQPTTILLVSADLTLPLVWNVNQTSRGGWANVTFRVNTGTPALDMTMPVPVAGNPTRTIELFNVHHDLPGEIFEATSLGDVLVKELCRYYGANTGTFRQTGGTSRLNNVWSNGLVTIIDKTAFPAAGNWDGLILSDPAAALTARSIAAVGTTLRLSNGSVRALLLSQTAPGVLAVSADVASLPVRGAVTVAGTATVAANLTLLNDAAAVAYSPTTPGNWAPVPATVQQALDELATGAAPLQTTPIVTYTGTPLYPITLAVGTPVSVIPAVANPGTLPYPALTGVSLAGFAFNENTMATADTGGLLSLSFDNIVSSGLTIDIQNMNLCTSLAFPLLTYTAQAAGINIAICRLLTSVSFPSLVVCGGTLSFSNNFVLASLSFPALTDIRQNLTLATSMPLLVTVSFPVLRHVGGNINPSSLPGVTNLSFPSLVWAGVNGGSITLNTLAALTTLGLPVLQYCGDSFSPNTLAVLTTISLPALLKVGIGPNGGNFTPNTMALLTTLTAPLLTDIFGTFAPATMAAMVTLSFPSLARITGAVSAAAMASLTTFQLAGMVTYSSTITLNSGLGNLTTLSLGTIGTLKAVSGATINVSGQKLNVASVDAVLALLVSLDGTGGTTLWGAGKTINISGGTSATPSATGLLDKATLIGRGATVTTN